MPCSGAVWRGHNRPGTDVTWAIWSSAGPDNRRARSVAHPHHRRPAEDHHGYRNARGRLAAESMSAIRQGTNSAGSAAPKDLRHTTGPAASMTSRLDVFG